MYCGFALVWSMSSIRNNILAPLCLANAAVIAKDNTLPTCKKPLGVGAIRVLWYGMIVLFKSQLYHIVFIYSKTRCHSFYLFSPMLAFPLLTFTLI